MHLGFVASVTVCNGIMQLREGSLESRKACCASGEPAYNATVLGNVGADNEPAHRNAPEDLCTGHCPLLNPQLRDGNFLFTLNLWRRAVLAEERLAAPPY
jgi:hypothetical protein